MEDGFAGPGNAEPLCRVTLDAAEEEFALTDFKLHPIKPLDPLVRAGSAACQYAEEGERWRRINAELARSSQLHELPANWRRFQDNDGKWQDFAGESVRVAVIDTGIDVEHPAFPEEAIERCVGVKEGVITRASADKASRQAAVQDRNGHGTHCAGIIAARKVGVVPFQGIAPRAKLLVYKVADEHGDARMSDVAIAVQDALEHRVDIVSLSLQGHEASDVLFAAIHRLLALRKMIICAAGNVGQIRQANVGYPARYGGVITVAAHDRLGHPAAFSSEGGEIDVSGPGERIWSTWPGARYRSMSGTSMAAPWIAGLSALILEKHRKVKGSDTPLRNNEDLREHLLRMAAHPGSYDPGSGYGPLWPGTYFRPSAVAAAPAVVGA